DGRIPTPDSRRRQHEANPEAFPEGSWFAGDNANLAIGQGEMLVTPLQLANAYAAFANGGSLHAPNIASKVLGSDNEVVRELAPRVIHTIDLPPHVREPILAGLVGVASSDGGTANFVFEGFPLSTYPVAAKTGTAQTSGEDNAVFVAFGPAYAPQWVVAVVLEQAGFGATAAAPLARTVFDAVAGQVPIEKVQPVPPLVGLVDPGPVADAAPTTDEPPPPETGTPDEEVVD
ncbi:MAG: penicillin-binding transpeptidase domain-containing protein, partial [Actinomycetota bacterium]